MVLEIREEQICGLLKMIAEEDSARERKRRAR